MNKHNAAQYLPLVKALADGKTVQSLSMPSGWEDNPDPAFSLPPEHYRIKPDPRRWWMAINDKCRDPIATRANRSELDRYDEQHIIEIIEVVEVVK